MKHLYRIINTETYIEESNGKKYLTVVPTDKSRKKLREYEKISRKMIDLIRSTKNNSHNYDKKYMKIKLNSHDDLPMKKTLEFQNIIIVVRSVFSSSNTFSPQGFSDDCLYKPAR